jgi:hypothetical protein
MYSASKSITVKDGFLFVFGDPEGDTRLAPIGLEDPMAFVKKNVSE